MESSDLLNEYLMKPFVDIIYLDFSKAFDTVFYIVYIFSKRHKIDIVRYFLTYWTMKVKVGNNYSETQNIHSDIHKGFA